MASLGAQLVETWRIHNRVNLQLLSHMPEGAIKATLSKRGGRDIARQFAHLQMVRVSRLESFARKQKAKLITFEKGESPRRDRLGEALTGSGLVMEQYLQCCLDAGGAVSSFRRGVIPMLGYFISHEAHHRGSILLSMKQSGFPLPDELNWGIWEWNTL